MPLSYQSAKLAPNATHTFTFPSTVTAYAAGIASFLFTYGDDDHHVEQLSLSLNSNKPTGTQVTVTVTGILKDADGHDIDVANSYVLVVVLAWIGSATSTTILSQPISEGNGQQSGSIFLPGSNPAVLQSSLSGFDLNYGADHHVEGVNVAIGAGSNGNQAVLTATAKMWDGDGNEAVNPTTSGFLLASVDQNPGFIATTYTAQNSLQQTIDMGQPLTDAVSLMTSFKVEYDGDHHVQTVGAGPDVTKVNPNNTSQVITSGVWGFMNDDSGNSQDNSLSNCTIVVIGFTS